MTSASEPVRLLGYRREALRPAGFGDCVLVVPTYRRPAEMLRLLERLETLSDVPAEVVIVDGSEDKETATAVVVWARDRDLRFDIGLVRSSAGLTRQRNVGIDASRREIVCFLDDDALPEPGYFAAVRSVFTRDLAREIGAVSGSVVNEMDRPLDLRWRLRFRLGLLPRNGVPGKYYPTAASLPRSLVAAFSGERDVDVLPGCAMSFRRAALEHSRFSMYFEGYAQGEDLEISLRVRRRWRILWSGDARVIHDHSSSGRPVAFAKGRMEVRNRFFIRERYSSDASWRERALFWLDIAYVFAWDFVYLISRRPPGGHLRHAAGVVAGAVSCFSTPPHFEEPAPQKEYEIAWTPMPKGAESGEEAS